MQRFLSLFIAILCHACEHKPESPSPTASADASRKEDTAKALSGKLASDDGIMQCDDFKLWLVDQTKYRIIEQITNNKGQFAFPITSLQAGSEYSFHILDSQYRYVAAVSFSQGSVSSGVVSYQGEQGFHLDTLNIPTSSFGTIDTTDLALSVSIGGGFALATDKVATFAPSDLPEGISSFLLHHQLIILDRELLLRRFFTVTQGSDTYWKNFMKHSYGGIYVESKGKDDIHAQLRSGFAKHASTLAFTDATLGTRAPWSKSAFQLLTEDGSKFFRVFTLPLKPTLEETFWVQIGKVGGTIYDFPSKLKNLVGYPAKITAFTTSGSSLTEIDYSDATAINGLTKPFVSEGQTITIALAAPKDELAASLASSLSTLKLSLRYLTRNDSGEETEVPRDSLVFAESYADVKFELLDIGARSWNPDKKTVTYMLTGASDPLTLSLEPEILLLSSDPAIATIVDVTVDFSGSGGRSVTTFRIVSN